VACFVHVLSIDASIKSACLVTDARPRRLRFERFLSRGSTPTTARKPSLQLNLESGTICRQTSDSQTCHTAISVTRWKHFYLVDGKKAQC